MLVMSEEASDITGMRYDAGPWDETKDPEWRPNEWQSARSNAETKGLATKDLIMNDLAYRSRPKAIF